MKPNSILIQNVQKRYHQHIVINDLNLKIFLNGTITSLVGANGSGKSTIMKILAGILFWNEGVIKVQDEKNAHTLKQEQYIAWANKNVAYLSSSERYLSYKNTAEDNIYYYCLLKGIQKQKVQANINQIAEMMNCQNLLKKRVEELSFGQKKLIKIISIFCTQLPLLLLDEPTLGLDVDAKEKLIDGLMRLQKRYNCTVIISSHDFDFVARIASQHLFVFNGKIEAFIHDKKKLDEIHQLYKHIQGGI